MCTLTVSEIQITLIKPRDNLIAFASCVINNHLYIGSIAIYTSPSTPDGFRISYPLRVLHTGKQIHCVHPISHYAGETIRKAIVNKYKELTCKIDKN